ncbi:CDC27 protein [Ophidiomyces ophidiicola]|nr:CDC27 protein [Ophidiomyces ophidiicola]
MPSDYKPHLAQRLLDGGHVTYRSLSRDLNVHCNHAKRMLYEFHRHENSKKPNSVYATYILTGLRQNKDSSSTRRTARNGDDEIIHSSPFIGSQPAIEEDCNQIETSVTSILLANEDELQEAKGNFQSLYSIFVYSVQAAKVDLNALADITQIVSKQDPLQCGPTLGMIQNKNVKRRTGTVPPPVPVTAPTPPKANTQKPTVTTQVEKVQEQKPELKTEGRAKIEPWHTSQLSESQSFANQPPRPSSVKHSGSDFFKAFGKARPKTKGPSTVAPKIEPAELSGTGDVVMGGDSDEEENEDLFLDSKKSTHDNYGQLKKEREAELRKMMEDDDDDEMPDAPRGGASEEPTSMEKTATAERPATTAEPAPAPTITHSGQRRGKRQVVKKKTFKDADGYLVTKEEKVWESFSEDEPEPPKKRPAVSTAGKPKATPKTGQGNLMSFFGKKP